MKTGLEKRYPEYLTTGTIARYCGVSKVTVLRWIEKGRLPAFRLPDKHYRIHRQDFAKFLTEYEIPVHQGIPTTKSKGRHA